MKTVKVVAAIIKKDNKILIASRKKGEFAGMFEFPGGKIEPGESGEQALIREIQEELETTIGVGMFYQLYLAHLNFYDNQLLVSCKIPRFFNVSNICMSAGIQLIFCSSNEIHLILLWSFSLI